MKSPRFENKRFSVAYTSEAYNDNFNQAFGRKYFLNFIEEFWPGQIEGTHIGRVEVSCDESRNPYPIEEIRFSFVDLDRYAKIRKGWDFIRVSKERLEELREILNREAKKAMVEIRKRR